MSISHVVLRDGGLPLIPAASGRGGSSAWDAVAPASPLVAVYTKTRTAPASRAGGALSLRFPEFGYTVSASRLEQSGSAEEDGLTANGSLGQDASIKLLVSGEDLRIWIDPVGDRPRAKFVASKLHALLGLAGNVVVSLGATDWRITGFDWPLKAISQALRAAGVAYRLMVIESATGMSFRFPCKISRDEMEGIAFVHRAISARSFTWPLVNFPLRLKAVPEERARMEGLKEAGSIKLEGFASREQVLGQAVELGPMNLVIERGLVIEFEKVMSELAVADGHLVQTTVTALDGVARIEAPKAPRLVADAWGANIDALIAMAPVLSTRLAERYNTLAESTLASFSERQKSRLTARTRLPEPRETSYGDKG
jgi:hypothetical protein